MKVTQQQKENLLINSVKNVLNSVWNDGPPECIEELRLALELFEGYITPEDYVKKEARKTLPHPHLEWQKGRY